MRAFITSSIILTLLIALIFANSALVSDKLDVLIPLCEQAKGSPDALERLDSEWRNCRDFISLSTHRDELDRVELALGDALSYRDRSAIEYAVKLDELQSALEILRRMHEISFYNIF